MQLSYLGSILPQHTSENKITSLAWSPNNLKLAVATSDRSIFLFDEKGVKRDRFSTKPIDSQNGKKSYSIKGIAFSPDSTKIAVGQTDNIVFVYKIGEEWGSKKVICNKFPQNSSVTCVAWPAEGPIIVGLIDGKVRAAITRANKSQTLYGADSETVALAVNLRGTGFISSHADGSIIRYYIAEDGNAEASGRLATYHTIAYALAWPQSFIMAAGCDRKISFFDSKGKVTKVFDYINDETEKEFTVACSSPSGQSIAVGSWDRIRVFDWNTRKNVWEDSCTKTMKHFYTITALAWKKDGSKLIAGGLLGNVEQFETVLKRTMIRGSHEVAYTGPNQVVIRSIDGSRRPVVVRSQMGTEIEDVKIKGRNENRVIAKTALSLLICDLDENLVSEIPWENNTNSEKFYFEYPGVCLIFRAGELIIVEYGHNEPLATVRTEAVNPHVVSVRINERRLPGAPENKRLAYLLDPRTVRIVDMVSGMGINTINHDERIDWLELSETGHRLLSRDKGGKLWLSDDLGGHVLLLTGTTFASWVAGSDVVVAQSGSNLAVWYNVDAPEASTFIPIRGEAIDIVRADGKTSVIVEESGNEVAYVLDEGLIEFGTALHDNDFGRVILFLEELGDKPQTEIMWENVANNAMGERSLIVASRCYAALGDVACAKFLKDIVETGEKYAEESGNDPLANSDCWAKLAILKGELKTAEAIYLEQNELQKALEMYQRYWHWEDAIALAQNRHWSGVSELRDKHLAWLLDTGQSAKAAGIIESDNPRRAFRLYLDAKRPSRAARLLLANEELLSDDRLVDEVIRELKAAELMELAGEIFERIGDMRKAIDAYAASGTFSRALELARKVEPNSVVKLERDWGKFLVSSGHHDAAINHFIEAGETTLALNAAVNARQWRKALQIIQVIEVDDPEVRKQCEKLADHFVTAGDLTLGEKLYIRANIPRRAVEAYMKANNWNRAQELALQHMDPREAKDLLATYAEGLRSAGDLRHAESLYVATEQFDEAIAMYRQAGLRQDMIRMVAKYRPELLKITHSHLAKELETAGKIREAEEHFLGADDWKSAVAAYKNANMWEDALRVAKMAAGEAAAQQVALLWARTLAPELGARLLTKMGYFDVCLKLASDAGLFDWALEVAKYGTVEQQKEVHYKYAMSLEDEGRFADAEREFLKAEKPMEAVQMYIHTKDWDAAEEVAQNHCSEGLGQVLIAKAAEAAESQDFALAESLLLRAHKPEIIINHYKNAGMWSEAMRVCREYLPSQEAALRREMGQRSGIVESSGAVEEARRWLEVGELRSALDILNRDSRNDRTALMMAADILLHRAEPELAVHYAADIGSKLFSISEYPLAAQVYLIADRLKDAINALAAAGDWNRARRIVTELAPDLTNYLEDLYKESMIKEGQVENLARIDADAAIDILIRKGQWAQVFETAKSKGVASLHKFLAQRAVQLIKTDDVGEALELYVQYGAPPMNQNFPLYNHLAESVLNSEQTAKDYPTLSKLRNILLELSRQLNASAKDWVDRFHRLLKATHYFSVRVACEDNSNLSELVLKTSITLLRYTDIIVADRCYFEAGTKARMADRPSESFVFFNHFLDIEECVEEGPESAILDVDDLRVTDFPLEIPLPASLSLSSEEREKVREWVLTVSVDQKVEQGLPLDPRGVYVGSLTSHSTGATPLPECVLTGYPVRGAIIQFDNNKNVANRDDWNKMVATARQTPPDSYLNDIFNFIKEWYGAVPNYTF